MVTKDKLKKEIDKLPKELLEEAYSLLKKIHLSEKHSKDLKPRDFGGKYDAINIRKEAHE